MEPLIVEIERSLDEDRNIIDLFKPYELVNIINKKLGFTNSSEEYKIPKIKSEGEYYIKLVNIDIVVKIINRPVFKAEGFWGYDKKEEQ